MSRILTAAAQWAGRARAVSQPLSPPRSLSLTLSVALTLALQAPEATVWAVDVNERALDLTRRNAARLDLANVVASRPEDVPDDVRFATLWSNPPIRVGKDVLHDLLRTWLPRLEPGADGYLVVQRNLGADSLQAWIDAEVASGTNKAASAKGFRVLRVPGPAS